MNKIAWLLMALLVTSPARAAFEFVDAATMLDNLSGHIPALMQLVTALAYIFGFFFTYKGLIELKKFGEQRTMMSGEHHLAGPMLYLFVAAMLIYLPTTVWQGLYTFWQEPTPYAYVQDSTDGFAKIMNAVFLIVQLVGTISLIRGLVLLTSIGGSQGGQQGAFGRAMAHIIAGLFCINLYGFIGMLGETLGVQWV